MIGENSLPEGWKEVELREILDYEQPNNYIIKGEILKNKTSNSVPVLTANKSFILGYTNEKEGVFNKLPAIIFDDFTTDMKFVEFEFKVKSSAMKILRPKSKNIDLKFVFCMMKGINIDSTTHKRYYLSSYQKKKIPLSFTSDGTPDLKAQQKIIAIIKQAEQLKEWRKESDKLTDDYLNSVFLEMFGDPIVNPKKWEIKKLEEVTDRITDGKHGDCRNENDSGYYFISAKDLKEGIIDYSEARQIVKEDFMDVHRRTNLELNDVLISNSGTIGKIAIATDVDKYQKTTFQKSVAIIKNKKDIINSQFLKHVLELSTDYLINYSSGSSQKNLLLRDIRNHKIIFPPIELQYKFAEIVQYFKKIQEKQKQSKSHIENLFNVLMQKAFRGELAC